MPYFMLKTILKVSNPIAMIRGEYLCSFYIGCSNVTLNQKVFWICSLLSLSAGAVFSRGKYSIVRRPQGFNALARMFTSSLSEEVKALEEDIEAVKDKVDDPVMCAKIRQFVYAPREIQEMYKADAGILFSPLFSTKPTN